MEYFKKYNSNTYAGSGNQLYFEMKENETRVGRIFYKISVGGEYNYSILFSNIVDSTYADGAVSHKNLICDEWVIHSAKIGKCTAIPSEKELSKLEDGDIKVSGFKELTFDGKSEKQVKPGEFLSSDSIKYSYDKGEYLCLEITFSGRMIPYHEETLLPVFVLKDGSWEYSKYMPFAGMIGCDREVGAKVAYLGDSITQGIGTKENSYMHWNALLSEKIGDKYSFWNLGLGYGRANDAASNGAWLYKAKQNDIVFVCYGVNDILRGSSEMQIKADLIYIVNSLKNSGAKVVLQTIPPFDWQGEEIYKWRRINNFIKTVMLEKADIVFDNVPILGKDNMLNESKFGGHPNEEGCKIWADELYEAVKNLF